MTDNAFTINDQPRDYSAFDLDQNPFPYSPVPSDDPELYCGQETVTSAVSDTVSSVLGTGKSKHLVITGKYGNGKSHTLKYTRGLIRDRDDVLVGYVAQPGEGFLDIYHEFMYDIGFDGVQAITYEYLATVAREETDKTPSTGAEAKQLLDDGELLLADLIPSAIRQLSELTRFADFARAMVHLVYEDTNLYAWQWLTGEGIRYEQRKEMEIHSALDDDTMGVRAFTSFKNVLLALSYTSVFVFIDEFESIARLSPKDEQGTLNSIRHLMDQNSSGLCLLFACAPEVWQEVMSEYHAFSERIGQEVALKPLTVDTLHDLVTAYLNRARVNGADDIGPFSPASLETILHLSQGNIRQILWVCSRVLDIAVDTGIERIEPSVVEDILE